MNRRSFLGFIGVAPAIAVLPVAHVQMGDTHVSIQGSANQYTLKIMQQELARRDAMYPRLINKPLDPIACREWMWADEPVFKSVSYSKYSPSDIGRPSNEPENK